MFTNDLNSTYEYERERRNDERRAAVESRQARGHGNKLQIILPSPAIIILIAVLLLALFRLF